MKNEGLKFFRFSMLTSSIAPLFVLLAIKGSNFKEPSYNFYFTLTFLILSIITFLPYVIKLFLVHNDQAITRQIESRELISDCKDKYSSYILSVVLPIYQNSLNTIADFFVFIAILLFIISVFYIFNLYYLNIIFYFLGFKIYEITPSSENFETFVLITKKDKYDINIGKNIFCKKITNGLFLEVEGDT